MTNTVRASVDDQPAARLSTALTRRRFLKGAAGIAAALPLAGLLAACGSDDSDDSAAGTGDESAATATTASSPAPPTTAVAPTSVASPTSVAGAAEGEWSFTDDLGNTLTLPQRPERIVAYVPTGAALWDFGVRPVGVYGTTLRPDGTPEITTGSIDLDAVESLGETYGELDIEKLVALEPDLIVADLWGDTLDVWGLEPDAAKLVTDIAPIVAIRYIDLPVSDLIARIGELAAALGADLAAPKVVDAQREFERASDDLEAAIAEKPGMTALFMAGWQDALYIANPESWADLIYFSNLGLDIVMPDSLDEGYPIWQTLSWEQATKYPADIALQDARAGAPAIAELAAMPTWAAHPATKADQVFAWRTEYVASYQGFTVVLDELTESVSASSVVV